MHACWESHVSTRGGSCHRTVTCSLLNSLPHRLLFDRIRLDQDRTARKLEAAKEIENKETYAAAARAGHYELVGRSKRGAENVAQQLPIRRDENELLHD